MLIGVAAMLAAAIGVMSEHRGHGKYQPMVWKMIYTTNAIESMNMTRRKMTKNRASFPSDDALLKLFYLAPRNMCRKRTMPSRDWPAALTRFTIQFEDWMLHKRNPFYTKSRSTLAQSTSATFRLGSPKP